MKSLSTLCVAIVAPFLLGQCRKAESHAELSFAKSTFESLARGDVAVAKSIDWPTLNSLGQNVGVAYVQIPSAVEKDNFEKAFITQFAASFRNQGGTPDKFVNWRVTAHDDLKTEVAADSPGGTLTLVVTERDGTDRISALGFLR